MAVDFYVPLLLRIGILIRSYMNPIFLSCPFFHLYAVLGFIVIYWVLTLSLFRLFDRLTVPPKCLEKKLFIFIDQSWRSEQEWIKYYKLLQVAEIGGISKLLVAENAAFEGFLPEKLAPVLVASQSQFNFTHIVAGASAFSR